MSPTGCSELPERNFLITLVSRDDGAECTVRLVTPCVCDIHEWVASIAHTLPITNPRVTHIDDKAAHHLPLHPEVCSNAAAS